MSINFIQHQFRRWTNDSLKATLHQVVEHPNNLGDIIPERYSIAFFCNANKDVVLEPLLSGDDDEPKYEPINAHEYLTQRLGSTISADT
jgi:isopenicillin N synthase-like dioxygenase